MRRPNNNSSKITLAESKIFGLESKEILEIIDRIAVRTDQRTALNGCGGFPLSEKHDTIAHFLKKLVKRL